MNRNTSFPTRRVAGLHCLACQFESFEVLSDGDITLFRCVVCRCCWYVTLGYVTRFVGRQEMFRPVRETEAYGTEGSADFDPLAFS